MMDDILSDNSLDRLDRIERLESILAAASHHALPSPVLPSPSPALHFPAPAPLPAVCNNIQKVYVDAETQV